MSLHTQVSISDAFIIFFLTLGPLKAIGPFTQAAQGADPALLRTLAWRATAIATGIVIGVLLFSSVVLEQWGVSMAALVMTASIILFCQSLQLIMEAPAPVTIQPQEADPSPPSLALAYFPVAVPGLITAPGIAAIVAFIAIAGGDWGQIGIVFGTLLVIMALNLVTLLNAEAILRRVPSPLLKVVGWVMAVLQAALAMQYLFNGLVRAGVIPPLSS